MNSLLDNDTKQALENMAKPLKDKLVYSQNSISDTLTLLEKLQTKLAGGK